MLPLILLALGLGAALSVYEFSPRARAHIDDYARAIRAAHEAHRAADMHLSNAHMAAGVAAQHAQAMIDAQRTAQYAAPQPAQFPQPAPVPSPPPPAPTQTVADAHAVTAQVAADTGVDHAIAATVANQQAAQSTADAARSARTTAERLAAADSASRVLEREKRIEGALASLGVGQCGVRSYPRVTPQVRDAILAKLHADGMIVTGDNPWDVDTQMAGVKLRAVWDPRTQVLRLIVTASALFATCEVIWERVDPSLRSIIGP